MEIDITGLESEFHFEHHFSIDEKKMANVIDILNFEVNYLILSFLIFIISANIQKNNIKTKQFNLNYYIY